MGKIYCGRVSFDATRYYADPRRYERVLCRARDAREELLCACVSPARRLVVRLINNQHWLAVWPNDREQHDYKCPVRRHGEGEAPATLARTFGQPKLESLGELMQDLLPRLWHRAGLQGPRAGPQTQGETGQVKAASFPLWSAMRDRVMAVASGVELRGVPLSSRLHVADPRRRGAGPLDLDGRLILAPIHSVMPTRFGWRVRLHFLDEPVFVSSQVSGSASLADWCDLLARPDSAGPEVAVALLEVHRTKGSNLTVDSGAMFAALSSGQLTAWHAAGALGSALLEAQRSFALAPLLDPLPGLQASREDLLAGARLDLPTFVMLDCTQRAVGLFVLDRDMPQQERDETARGVLAWVAAGGGAWVWDLETHDDPPPLPPCAYGAPSRTAWQARRGVPCLERSCGSRAPSRPRMDAQDDAELDPQATAS